VNAPLPPSRTAEFPAGDAARAERRRLGDSGLAVSPVAFGAWPIAGISTRDVNETDSRATIAAALDHGVNFLDTAYCYGRAGESERLIGEVLAARRRDDVVLATKGGVHFPPVGPQVQDARPETLRRQCEESLRRLRVEAVELYYLHAPDARVPVAESAGAIADLMAAGKVRAAGASNCTLEQLEEFHRTCPVAAVQLPYNMLQRDIERRTVPWCLTRGIAVTAYWPLMKGLLAGRIDSPAALASDDSRRTYPMYQGEEFDRNRALVRRLQAVADARGCTAAQLVVNWTLDQPGITSVLCGARRPWQIAETAGAMGWRLADVEKQSIAEALAERGVAAAKRVFE
jgi:aryl-alcohol dehydrogenase-like predicted oxidoreductase